MWQLTPGVAAVKVFGSKLFAMPNKSSLAQVRAALKAEADPSAQETLMSFFKTGPGEYGEGDLFIGVTVPSTRSVAKRFSDLARTDVLKLLKSKIHEERLLALIMMIRNYEKGDLKQKVQVYSDYLAHLKYVNNWDLVDVSAHKIVGAHLETRARTLLNSLARSKRMWDRRVAVVATHHFIRKGDYADILRLSERLLEDEEDLMHKAVGWMLREMGKRDLIPLKNFLKKHHTRMPRTMLRYAIEKFSERERKAILRGDVDFL